MNLTIAVVRATAGDEAMVEVESTGCGRCKEPGGCGSSSKADLFCHGRTYTVSNPLGAVAGERVRVAIDDGVIGRSATRAYLVPLLMVFVGAGLGHATADAALTDVGSIFGAIVGLAAGWSWLHLAGPANAMIGRPTIVDRV